MPKEQVIHNKLSNPSLLMKIFIEVSFALMSIYTTFIYTPIHQLS